MPRGKEEREDGKDAPRTLRVKEESVLGGSQDTSLADLGAGGAIH